MNDETDDTRCELCGRHETLSKHHLIPRAVHRKKRFRKMHSTQEMRDRGLMLCKLCHKGLHDLYTEKELGERLNNKEELLLDERVAKHVNWVRKQKGLRL